MTISRQARQLTETALRLLAASLLVAIPVILAGVESAVAQTGSLTGFTTTVDVRYGEELAFRAEASANATLSGARLTAQIAGTNRVFTEVVAIAPGTSISAEHTLTTTQLQMPPFAEISYYWDFQDQNGVEYRTPTETLWYADTLVPWEWQETTQADITVYSNGRDPQIAAAALEIATQTLTRSERALGTRYDGQMRLYVYPDLSALANALRAHDQQVQDWVAAYAIPSQQTALVSADGGADLAETLQRDIAHEVSHLVVAQATGAAAEDLPGWFNEGLALTASGIPDSTLRGVLSDANRSNSLIPLADLCIPSFTGLPPQAVALAYAESESVMDFITNRYGAAQVQGLARAMRDGASCEGAVEQTLGISLAELESQWHNGAVTQAVADSPGTASLTSLILIWAIGAALAMLFIAPQPFRAGDAYEEEADDPNLTRPMRPVQRPDSAP